MQENLESNEVTSSNKGLCFTENNEKCRFVLDRTDHMPESLEKALNPVHDPSRCTRWIGPGVGTGSANVRKVH
jgi:hypothetical protein